jgi:hypothetical protein
MTRLVHVLSMILFVVHLLAPCCMGQSPDGALAAESVHRLKGILKNCEFAGVIRNDDVRVIDSDYRRKLNVSAWICDEAFLIRWHSHVQVFDDGKTIGKDRPSSEQDESHEWRRIGDGPLLDCHIEPPNTGRWPEDSQDGRTARLFSVFEREPNLLGFFGPWGGKVFGEFIYGLNIDSGITFEDLVTSGGRFGFHEDIAGARQEHDRLSRAYHFRSDLYGTCDVTLTQISGSWMPTRFVLTQSADNQIEAPDPATGRPVSSADGKCLRVSDLPPREDASAPGVERMETTYAITYENMPTQMEKTVVMDYGGRPYTSTWKLVFSKFQSGHVTRTDVETAAMPIPNGTKVHTHLRQNSRIRYEYRDGKVIRATDVTSINIAESARFSTSRKVALLTTSIIVVALAILLLYRRALRG